MTQCCAMCSHRYRGLAHENAMAPLKTLEDRLAQCQRDADARIRAEVEEAVTRVRKVEMSKMRLEEQAKYSQQLAQVSLPHSTTPSLPPSYPLVVQPTQHLVQPTQTSPLCHFHLKISRCMRVFTLINDPRDACTLPHRCATRWRARGKNVWRPCGNGRANSTKNSARERQTPSSSSTPIASVC